MSRSADAKLASAEVHGRLQAQILGGELAPGDRVPSERTLSDELGVNRHAIREGLKRLQQAGLIEINQGGATRVLDWRRSAGLDLLLDLMQHGEEPPRGLVRSVLEMRASVGVDAVRRCIDRAGEDRRAEIAASAAALADATESGGEPPVGDYVELWGEIVDGSGNLAYRLALNSLNAALDSLPALAAELTPDDPADLRRLGEAIGGGDADAAVAVARGLLEGDIAVAG
jgi:DNA-binding FadR family transcriptional regulator